MAVRDLSPSPWTSQSTARFGIEVSHTGDSNDGPMPLDVWISNYSPYLDEYVDLNSGFNSIIIDATITRFIIVVPPEGNTTSITIKGITGDTGTPINPNGVFMCTMPASGAPTTFGITLGADLSGIRIIVM